MFSSIFILINSAYCSDINLIIGANIAVCHNVRIIFLKNKDLLTSGLQKITLVDIDRRLSFLSFYRLISGNLN